MFTDDELKPFGYEPGQYLINCACGDLTALADKRATRCYRCAAKVFVASLRTRAESAERKAQRMKSYVKKWTDAAHWHKDQAAQWEQTATSLLNRAESAERERDEAYAKGQRDFRERAKQPLLGEGYQFEPIGIGALRIKWAKAVAALPIKERP